MTSVIFNTKGMTEKQSISVNSLARYAEKHGSCESFESWREEDGQVYVRMQFNAEYDYEVCTWSMDLEGEVTLL